MADPTFLLIAAMLAFVLMANELPRLRDGHRCPICLTQREGEHSEGCPYRKENR